MDEANFFTETSPVCVLNNGNVYTSLKMRLIRLCPAPRHAVEIRNYYDLDKRSFAEQIDVYRKENLVLPGGWAQSMVDEGFVVFETCCDDLKLQASWAKENRCEELATQENAQFQILAAQIRSFQPDILFLYAGAGYIITRGFRDRLRHIAPANMMIAIYWGDQIPPGRSYSDYFGDVDLAFASSPVYLKHFTDAGIDAVMTGNAFDPSIRFTAPRRKTKDVIFCGTAGFGFPEHFNRYKTLRYLLGKTTLEVYSDERPDWRGQNTLRAKIRDFILTIAEKFPDPLLAMAQQWHRFSYLVNKVRQAKKQGISIRELMVPAGEHPLLYIFNDEQPLSKLFPGRLNKPKLLAKEYYSLLASSKLVLNIHRGEDADIGNIRCFEATGVGSCLITDRGDSLKEFFDVENDIVTFETAEECAEKIKYLLAHPDEMDRIAKNGQRTTLERHTVIERSKIIAATLRERRKFPRAKLHRILAATYDLEYSPLSYDIAFFVQAAEIQRQLSGCEQIALTIVAPKDIDNQAGVSKEVYSVVDGRAREFRIDHLCAEIAKLMPSVSSITVKYAGARELEIGITKADVVPYPNGQPHHNEYYHTLNRYPDLVSGFSATVEARRFAKKWLEPIGRGRKIVCVSLRQYEVDVGRNSNMRAWKDFLDRLDPAEYAVVIVPDTDHIADFKASPLGIYPAYEPASFVVDLRMAIYECAYLNMFVSSGPSYAATLFKNVNYLMFKIMQPGIALVSSDTLTWLGYEIGGTPKYATTFQKWVWEDDTPEVLYREFMKMDRVLKSIGDSGRAVVS